jgi:flagellar FliJ protein
MDDYGQLTRSNGPVLDSRRLHNARLFIGRLGDAVAEQESELKRAIARYEQEARVFKEAHRHQKAMERLFEQYYREERQAVERREQAEMDELILRLSQ